MFTKPFEQISKVDVGLAGGKGASLGEMTQAGIPVPPGFVVLAGTFDKFLQETQLDVEIEALLHKVNHQDLNSVEKVSEEIHALVLNVDMPQDIGTEILTEHKKLGAEFVAVRSSATAEDSSTASWAGELETYLNTPAEQVLARVKECWASLFTPRAIFYRFEKKLHTTKVSVAVVVQAMVQSEVSGICFTVHPVTKDYDQLVIEAGYGLGEAIVGGMVTPDTYVIHKTKGELMDKYISEQNMMIVKSPSGNSEVDVPVENRSLQKLSDDKILELAKLCQHIEKHYGKPQDIEWAWWSGKLHVLQSRPITTL